MDFEYILISEYFFKHSTTNETSCDSYLPVDLLEHLPKKRSKTRLIYTWFHLISQMTDREKDRLSIPRSYQVYKYGLRYIFRKQNTGPSIRQ